MKVINLHHPYDESQIPKNEVVLVLGFFDGVHLGHQKVIETAKEIAQKKNIPLAVMTFNHHPSFVFKKIDNKKMKYITTIDQKINRMKLLSVDIVYIVEFTSAFANLTPDEFINQYIIGLHATTVVAGFDYTFGKKGIAGMSQLAQEAKGRYDVVEVNEQSHNHKKISSTNIREMMSQGNMEGVNDFLGYPYELSGMVVHGDKRGRTLGFPTANIKVPQNSLLPPVGVYVVDIKVDGKRYKGMAQIGHNITFETNRPVTIEVNILDFNDDIYGEQVSVRWYHYLRKEKKFSHVDELVNQLKKDEANSRAYFQKNGDVS